MAGVVKHWEFEPIKLKLAERTTYTPDFLVVTDDQVECHEVKAWWEDDARVKIKVAAEKYWFFKFVAITRLKGVWQYEDF